MKLIERKDYLEKMINVIGTPDIKVITGVRRSGKSKLLEAFKSYVSANIETANIIHINFNLPDFDDLTEYRPLYDYINAAYKEGADNFVLIDEIQMCNNFEKAINGLHASEKFDIYITGSNAFLLSSDLATLFTGRTFEIKVYPFSFAEYVKYFAYTDLYTAFDKYVCEGGMAGSYVYKNAQAKYDYIAEVFNTLIVRDIRKKYKIRNTILMDRLADFLMIISRTSHLPDPLLILLTAIRTRSTIRLSAHICSISAMPLHFIKYADMTSRERNISRQMRNTTSAIIPSAMQSSERRIWTTAECLKIL